MANKAGNWATDRVATNEHNFAPESSLLEEAPDDADIPRRIERGHVVPHGLCLPMHGLRRQVRDVDVHERNSSST